MSTTLRIKALLAGEQFALSDLLREEGGDRGVIFAPGCALPLDNDRRLFGLLTELSQAQTPRQRCSGVISR